MPQKTEERKQETAPARSDRWSEISKYLDRMDEKQLRALAALLKAQGGKNGRDN